MNSVTMNCEECCSEIDVTDCYDGDQVRCDDCHALHQISIDGENECQWLDVVDDGDDE